MLANAEVLLKLILGLRGLAGDVFLTLVPLSVTLRFPLPFQGFSEGVFTSDAALFRKFSELFLTIAHGFL